MMRKCGKLSSGWVSITIILLALKHYKAIHVHVRVGDKYKTRPPTDGCLTHCLARRDIDVYADCPGRAAQVLERAI